MDAEEFVRRLAAIGWSGHSAGPTKHFRRDRHKKACRYDVHFVLSGYGDTYDEAQLDAVKKAEAWMKKKGGKV